MIDQFVAAPDGFAQVAAAQILQIRPEHVCQHSFLALLDGGMDFSEQSGAASQCLEATIVATTAFGSANFQDHMSDLTRSAVETGVNLAI